MATLTILEKETLEVLEQLEYRCEQFELYNEDAFGGEIEVMISDVERGSLKKIEDLYDIAKYLQKNGLDFSLTFDLENDSPDWHIDSNHPTFDFIQLGIIKGKDVKTIKESIAKLKMKLSEPVAIPSKVGISFDVKKGFYRTDNQTLNYPIRKGTKRFRLLKLLSPLVQSTSVSVIKAKTLHHSSNLVIKEVKEINRLFREKLKVKDDFVLHNETGGYLLNHEKFVVPNL